ncbi:hypothetical protein GT360_17725 [Vibrio astriarenae]|uniref:Uncharacterized protein n=1 Tax=Vibrio astriarenae TaxID=1481923 RepID=A0A7Z2T6N5_9VIBR|nr:hypothetical protein [Vibrio astriarenae]QIA65379.1 hypothetical protein GT360_17725 [Vibrio astriarenae]
MREEFTRKSYLDEDWQRLVYTLLRRKNATPLESAINVVVWLTIMMLLLLSVYHFISNFFGYLEWLSSLVLSVLLMVIYLEVCEIKVYVLTYRDLNLLSPKKELLEKAKDKHMAHILELSRSQVKAIEKRLETY